MEHLFEDLSAQGEFMQRTLQKKCIRPGCSEAVILFSKNQ